MLKRKLHCISFFRIFGSGDFDITTNTSRPNLTFSCTFLKIQSQCLNEFLRRRMFFFTRYSAINNCAIQLHERTIGQEIPKLIKQPFGKRRHCL